MENKIAQFSENTSASLFLQYGDVVSVEEVMGMLHIGRSAVYGLLQSKALRSVRVGRKYIIPKNSVIEFLANE